MRIDKFLKIARILKRRSVGKEACDLNMVAVNGKIVKPSFKIKVNDVVEVFFASGTLKFEILNIKETVKKEDASSLYRIITEN